MNVFFHKSGTIRGAGTITYPVYLSSAPLFNWNHGVQYLVFCVV